MIVRPNPGPNFSVTNYEAKAKRWKILWPELTVIDAESLRRPGERRDPCAAAFVLEDAVRRLSSNNQIRRLWVPAQGRDDDR